MEGHYTHYIHYIVALVFAVTSFVLIRIGAETSKSTEESETSLQKIENQIRGIKKSIETLQANKERN